MRIDEQEWIDLFDAVKIEMLKNGEIENLNLVIRKHEHPDDTIQYGRGFEGYSYMTINFSNGEKYVYRAVIHEK